MNINSSEQTKTTSEKSKKKLQKEANHSNIKQKYQKELFECLTF